MAIWIAALTGHARIAASYGLIAWHAHEFLFGYVGAVIAGFLLTAGPNWTERPPVSSGALLGLSTLWVAGRIALLAYDGLGILALAIDSSFLVALALWFAREIIVARNWLNLRIVALVSALAAANVAFHCEVVRTGTASISIRVGLSLIVTLIMLIGGRITPTFTRNWLIARRRPPYPVAFGRVDVIAIALGSVGLLSWVLFPNYAFSAGALFVGGAAHVVRLARWRGVATVREPLILILHLGYAFVPLGFLATGLAVLHPDILPASGALHAWTAGAIGVTTLGVMTRVTLSDTGRPPRAPRITYLVYGAAILAALLRIDAPMSAHTLALLEISAAAWALAFSTFLLAYGPMLLRTSVD